MDCVNAIFYDWTDVPNTYSNPKLRAVAKKIIGRTTADNLVKLVPYYVEHYPTIARAGYEETNIFNLDFNFNSMLMKVNSSKGSTKKKAANDTL